MEKDAEEAAQSAGFSAGSLMPAAIATGVTLGAPVIAGAMSAATAAGLIAVGVELQKGNPSIDQGWQSLVAVAKDGATQASNVMVTPIVDAMAKIQGNLQAEQPAFRQLFAGAAADIPIFTNGLLSLTDNALPGLVTMVDNSQPVIRGWGTVMSDVGSAVSTVASDVGNDSQTIGTDLSGVGFVVQQLADTVGSLAVAGSNLTEIGLNPIEDFAAGLHVLAAGAADVTGWVRGAFDAWTDNNKATSDNAQSTKVYGESLKQLYADAANSTPIFKDMWTNADQVAGSIGQMANSSQSAAGFLSQLDTQMALLAEGGMQKANDEISTFYQGLDTLSSNLATAKGRVLDANGALDLTSAKGRDVQSAVESARDAMTGYAQAAANAGAPTDEVTGHLTSMYSALENELLPAFGHNKQAVDNFLTSIGLVPRQIQTNVSAPGAVTSTDQMRGLMQQIQATPTGHTVTVTSLTSTAMAELQALGLKVTTLPNGQVSIVANTAAAKQAVDNFIAAESGRTIFVPIKGVADPASGQAVLGPYHALGGIQLHADGGMLRSRLSMDSVPARSVFGPVGGSLPSLSGYALHAPGDLTPMAPVAAMVPPNTWRDVVGDRADVDEAYIPLDGSPRSQAILGQANARMPGTQPAVSRSVSYTYNITQQPHEDGYALAHRLSAQTQWDMMHMVSG